MRHKLLKFSDEFLNLPNNIRAILIHGKDEGLVREKRDAITSQIISDKNSIFAISNLEAASISAEPSILYTDICTVSMFGDRRIVVIEGTTDRLTEIINNALKLKTADTLLLVLAGYLPRNSSLLGMFQKTKDAISIACHPDSDDQLRTLIGKNLEKLNIKPDPEAIDYLTTHLGNNRQITRSELEKISIFFNSPINSGKHRLNLEVTQSLVGDTLDLTIWALAAATTSTDNKHLSVLLDRAREERIGGIEILRSVQNRLNDMHLIRSLLDGGFSFTAAAEKFEKLFKRKLFFKDKEILSNQIRCWSRDRLKAALTYTLKTEILCKRKNSESFILASKTCMDLCMYAKSASQNY